MGKNLKILTPFILDCVRVYAKRRNLKAKLIAYSKPRGGGGALIFSHIRRRGPFFWVQNSEFQYFFEFSEKLIFFGGMKIFLWIFFLGRHKIGLV